MPLLIKLTKGHLGMAKDELLALAGQQNVSWQGEDLALTHSIHASVLKRLAYVNGIYSVVFECSEADLSPSIHAVNWNSLVHGSLAVRFTGSREEEPAISSLILSKLNKPKVDLRHPQTVIKFFRIKHTVVCTLLVQENKENFELRRSHLLRFPHPSGMHPRLARWFVNRTGIKRGTIVDPFCGAGGILLEAGLMGLKAKGFDIEPSMIRRAQQNLESFSSNIVLEVKDACSINKPIQFVATDLPYGRATKAGNINELYKGFLRVLEKFLVKKAVIGYPDFIDLASMVDPEKLRITGSYTYYLHKSLTKRIAVIEPMGRN